MCLHANVDMYTVLVFNDLIIEIILPIIVTLGNILYTGFMYNETKEVNYSKMRFSAVRDLHVFKEV